MGNKISLILSFVILVQAILFSGDIIGYQMIVSELIIQTVQINQLIQQQGGINDAVYQFVEDDLQATISCVSHCQPVAGDALEYMVSKPYQPILPMVWGNSVAHITIRRSVLIGYGQ